MSATNSLDILFNPKSVAIIGASATAGKVGYSVIRNIIDSGYPDRGQVYPINPKETEIEGLPAYQTIGEVPDEVELAVICIPAKFVGDAAKECGEKGVKVIVVITAGFKEIGGKGAEREKELVQICTDYNMRMLGPNCLGLITPVINATFAASSPKKGNIAFISQSGAMMTGILDWSANQPIGFSSFISIGNKANIDAVDLIEYLAGDAETAMILAYMEDTKDGVKFLEVVTQAAKEKPIIILKSGRSAAGAQAASSHTGSLAGSDIAYDLAFKRSGVLRAKTISDVFNYALVFSNLPLPKSSNFAIVTNAGGPGIVATDAFEDNELGFSRFSEPILKELREGLPEEANIYDPVDIVGDATPERYKFALETIFKEPDEICQGALVILTPQGQTNPPMVVDLLVEVMQQNPGKLLVGAFIGGKTLAEPMQKMVANKIPCYPFPEEGIQALKGMVQYSAYRDRPIKEWPARYDVDMDRVREILDGVKKDNRRVLLTSEASEIFTKYGILNPPTILSTSADKAAEAAESIGFPVVMKIVSPQILHKSDIGGVKLDITSREEVIRSYVEIISNAKKLGPQNAQIYGVEVQKMIERSDRKKTTEIIIGMNRDAQWGPMLMFGLGGIYVNFLKDVAFELAYKYDSEDALNQMSRTKAFTILKGVRGEPPSDVNALGDVLVRISQMVNDFPEIAEIDINPLLAFELIEGAENYTAVDIKITIKS
ncbi:MAG TPA: acetate--CoA ligase family protein [Candidatus Lokiarchaeia archaeon]|nr:acetate--CoA ligase family protein [Candidatus Lokiarchaeia archaeon]